MMKITADPTAVEKNYETEHERAQVVHGNKRLVYEDGLFDSKKYFAPRFTALNMAIYEEDEEAVNALLKNGADPNKPSEDGRNALQVAAWIGFPRESLFDELLAKIHDVNADTSYVYTGQRWGAPALIEAAGCDNLYIVVSLMKHPNIDVNVLDSNNETALHVAVDRNHLTIVTQLLSDKRVDDSLRNNNGRTALEHAKLFGHDCFDILWKHSSPKVREEFSKFTRERQSIPKWYASLMNHEE
jgi:ankyrin repeat protein